LQQGSLRRAFWLWWRNDLRVPHIQALATTFVVSMLLLGCGNSSIVRGLQPSDTQFSGKPDLNYDHIIVPGKRIGPVEFGGSVKAALAHLGNPDKVEDYASDHSVLWYTFSSECLTLIFNDNNLDPTVADVSVRCDKWATKTGIRVGLTVDQAIEKLSLETASCAVLSGKTVYIIDKRGMMLFALHKNAPIRDIRIGNYKDLPIKCP
jgi:hypothetical protein